MKNIKTETNKKFSGAAAGAFVCLFLCALCFILTVFGDVATVAVQQALAMCLTRLLPALFPYMTVSSMLVTTGSADAISRKIPVSRLFGLPDEASSAVILGFLCGFPLGAKTAAELYRRGSLSKSQAEVLISVANNTGPSFVVSVIGATVWKSAVFGWCLYLAQILSAVSAGILVNRIMSKPYSKPSKYTARGNTPICGEPLLHSFLFAVKDSVGACLNVCGFVTVFAVIIAYVSYLTDSVSPALTGGVASVLELTEASRLSSELAAQGNRLGGFFCGFALGFSGISVFCQAGAFTFPLGLSLKRTFFVKLLEGLMCGIAGFFLCGRFSPAPTAAVAEVNAVVSLPLFIAAVSVIAAVFVKILIKAYKM